MLALVALATACGSDKTQQVSCADGQAGPVATKAGTFCGLMQEVGTPPVAVNAFLGIPFAETTAGTNRWRDPVKKAPLGRFSATQFGPACPQAAGGTPDAPQSENCLSLNIWRPTGTPPEGGFPVMVWIYGGGFLGGRSSDPVFNGSSLVATQNVIMVSMNYRVGALGGLAGTLGSTHLTGNYGIRDQQLALQWVQNNIGHFGGDKHNLTIFGESAGAMSVGLHLLSIPSSDPLFRAGIMESNLLGMPYKDAEGVQAIAEAFAFEVGCLISLDPVGCMQMVPLGDPTNPEPGTILGEQTSLVVLGLPLVLRGIEEGLSWAPWVDGTLIVDQPMAAAMRGDLDKPTIWGTNRNEATSFVYAVPQSVFSEGCYESLASFVFGTETAEKVLANPAYAPSTDPATNEANVDAVGTSFLFTCADQAAFQQPVAVSPFPHVWAYQFTHHSDWESDTIFASTPQCGLPDQVCHGAELPYVFNTPGALIGPEGPSEFTTEEAALSQAMQTYWANFAKNQDPNVGEPVPVAWPPQLGAPQDSNYVVLNTPLPSVETSLPSTYECPFWDEIGYSLVGVGPLPLACVL